MIYVHFEEADPADTIERLLALGVGETIENSCGSSARTNMSPMTG